MKKIISSILILATIVLIGCKKDVKPESIVIDYSDNSVLVGEELTLTISSPTAKANLKVKWAVSDATIATISGSGVVKGVKVGTVEVTATSTSDTTKSDSVVFYVIDQITKEYREPVTQLLKFVKDENVLAKIGVWKQADGDWDDFTLAQDNYISSLDSWIAETKPFLGSHIPPRSQTQESWLYSVTVELIDDIDRGISFAYSIGSIDEYKDHFLENEEELAEEGYVDIKVVEVYKKINLYNPVYRDYDEYYYFAIGKKDNKLNILDYTQSLYFYNGLDFANNYFKGLTTISEIPLTELPSNFDYCLDPDYSRWGYRFDFDSKKAFKGYSLKNGIEITEYFLGAFRIGTSGLLYFDSVDDYSDVKYTTALSTIIEQMGYDSPSLYTSTTDSSFFNEEDYNYYVERYGSVEIYKFNFPNVPSLSFYFGIVKDGEQYSLKLQEYVITNVIDFINITLEMQRSYSSLTYSSIVESDIDINIKEIFEDSKEELSLTEISGYKVSYTNQFVTDIQNIYFFKDAKGKYYYFSY